MVGVHWLRTGKKECQEKNPQRRVTYLLVKAAVKRLFSERMIRLFKGKDGWGVQALIWLSIQYIKFSFCD